MARPESNPHDVRAEKRQAIAAVFGAEVVGKILGQNNGKSTPKPTGKLDPQRLAWQRTRLLERLQQKTGESSVSQDSQHTRAAVLDRLRKAAREDGLQGEHPAVIVHVLRHEPQNIRVSILRKLPGTTARMVIQRLKLYSA